MFVLHIVLQISQCKGFQRSRHHIDQSLGSPVGDELTIICLHGPEHLEVPKGSHEDIQKRLILADETENLQSTFGTAEKCFANGVWIPSDSTLYVIVEFAEAPESAKGQGKAGGGYITVSDIDIFDI